MAPAKDRVLLVSLDNLGDLVFAAGLIPPLRAAGREVSVWCKDYAAGALPFLPGLSSGHSSDPFWDRSPGRPKGSFFRFWGTVAEIRRRRYDAALLPNTRWRVAAAAALAGIPRRVGFDQRGSRRWLTDALPAEKPGAPLLPEWSRLLAPLGCDPSLVAPRLAVPSSLLEERARMAALLGRAAAVHPFAGDERRCAPPSFWKGLLPRLRELGLERVLVVGAPKESRAFAEAMADAGGPALVTAQSLGAQGLSGSLLALSACAAFIGHDSGPLHCACAFGLPSLGLYLPGDWPRAAPQGGACRVLRGSGPNEAEPKEAASLLSELLAGR